MPCPCPAPPLQLALGYWCVTLDVMTIAGKAVEGTTDAIAVLGEGGAAAAACSTRAP